MTFLRTSRLIQPTRFELVRFDLKTAKALGLVADVARPRRRCDRVEVKSFCCGAYVGLWHEADASLGPLMTRTGHWMLETAGFIAF